VCVGEDAVLVARAGEEEEEEEEVAASFFCRTPLEVDVMLFKCKCGKDVTSQGEFLSHLEEKGCSSPNHFPFQLKEPFSRRPGDTQKTFEILLNTSQRPDSLLKLFSPSIVSILKGILEEGGSLVAGLTATVMRKDFKYQNITGCSLLIRKHVDVNCRVHSLIWGINKKYYANDGWMDGTVYLSLETELRRGPENQGELYVLDILKRCPDDEEWRLEEEEEEEEEVSDECNNNINKGDDEQSVETHKEEEEEEEVEVSEEVQQEEEEEEDEQQEATEDVQQEVSEEEEYEEDDTFFFK